MEKQIKILVSNPLYELARIFNKSDAELYIVGGYVRNAILGIYESDIDICSKLTPEQLTTALAGTNYKIKYKSKKLGTVVIITEGEEYEHTTFRSEIYADNGSHTPISTQFVSDIRQDAKRRDFTINAIYYNILKREIVDIYSGIYDIEKRRIKCIETPNYVFSSDGLRILRLIRLACELNLKIEKETFLAAQKMSYRLKDITGQRKQKELQKILDSGTKYTISKPNAHLRGLAMFNRLKIWTSFYSSVSKIKLHMVKKSKDNYLSALLIDMINAIKPDCVEYYLQYLLGNKGLMYGEKQKNTLVNIVCGYFDATNKISNKKFFFKYFDNFNIIKEFIKYKRRLTYKKYNFFYKYIFNHNIPIVIKDLCVNGDDIKKYNKTLPEKYYGTLLKELLEKVFDAEVDNTKEKLIEEIKNYEHN